MGFFDHDFDLERVVLACLVKEGCGQPIHNDRPSHGLAFKCGGENTYRFSSGKTLSCKDNDIIYLPKGSSYRVENLDGGDCYAINFGLREEVSFEPFVIPAKDFRDFHELFRRAEKVWRQKDHAYRMESKALLYEILCKLQQEAQGYVCSEKYNRILPAVTYINGHYTTEELHVSKLARMCGITPEYFRSIFRDKHGVSPNQYIRTLRLTRMAELLSSELCSISEAATASGFEDLSYASREFKKRYGVSPRRYVDRNGKL